MPSPATPTDAPVAPTPAPAPGPIVVKPPANYPILQAIPVPLTAAQVQALLAIFATAVALPVDASRVRGIKLNIQASGAGSLTVSYVAQ